jgi:hypothetical protein
MLEAADDDVRARLIVFALVTLFAVLAGTTVLGIATNWPRHRTVSTGQSFSTRRRSMLCLPRSCTFIRSLLVRPQ